MAEQQRSLTVYEKRELERILRESTELVVRAHQFVDAIGELAKFALDVGTQLVPAIVGLAMRAAGRLIEAVAVGWVQLWSDVDQALINSASKRFIQSMAEARLYAEPIARARKEAAARRFLQDMSRFGVTGVSLDELMAQ